MNTTHKAPAFQLYPTEELSDLFGTSAAARGVYTTLRAKHWLERSLPPSPRALAQLAGVTVHLLRQVWPEIATLFERRRGRLVLPRLLAIQRAYDAHAAERSASGIEGANRRWKNHVPKKPRSLWAVRCRLAHTVQTDGKLLVKYRGDDVSMFDVFKERLTRHGLHDPDDRQLPRKVWEAAKAQAVKKNREQMRRVK